VPVINVILIAARRVHEVETDTKSKDPYPPHAVRERFKEFSPYWESDVALLHHYIDQPAGHVQVLHDLLPGNRSLHFVISQGGLNDEGFR